MRIHNLRKAVKNEEIDYIMLKSLLADYAHPRTKISALLKSGSLIRIKKGLYIFGPELALGPYSKEVLANLIYGPSSISLEYALAFYGLIPERVETITSVTNKRDKEFTTPIGHFSYRYLNPERYSIGITQIKLDETHNVLIATPEKALADKIVLSSPNLTIEDQKDIEAYLFEDLRLDEDRLYTLKIGRLQEISKVYSQKNLTSIVRHLIEAIRHA